MSIAHSFMRIHIHRACFMSIARYEHSSYFGPMYEHSSYYDNGFIMYEQCLSWPFSWSLALARWKAWRGLQRSAVRCQVLLGFPSPSPSPTGWGWIFYPHLVGGGGAAAATLTHRVGVTHHPGVVGTPARWAETNYPAGINLGQWPSPHSHHQCSLVAEA